MAARKDPASQVVAFFETASVETAQTVLAICKSIVARRQPLKAKRLTRAEQRPGVRAVEEMAMSAK